MRETEGDRTFTDVNYIIPTFILTQLPIGLIGLLIVAILMAATDTIAAELNSLSTATVIDFYKRWCRPTATDAHYLTVSKIATGLWGLFACAHRRLGGRARFAHRGGQSVRLVLLRIDSRRLRPGGRRSARATANGAFFGLIAGMASVAWAATLHECRVSLAQRDRRRGGRRRRAGGQRGRSCSAVEIRDDTVEADPFSARFLHFRSACGLAAELGRRHSEAD